MATKIIFTVGADGSIEVDARQGYEGNACLKDTAMVVDALKGMGIDVTVDQIRLVNVEVANEERTATSA